METVSTFEEMYRLASEGPFDIFVPSARDLELLAKLFVEEMTESPLGRVNSENVKHWKSYIENDMIEHHYNNADDIGYFYIDEYPEIGMWFGRYDDEDTCVVEFKLRPYLVEFI